MFNEICKILDSRKFSVTNTWISSIEVKMLIENNQELSINIYTHDPNNINVTVNIIGIGLLSKQPEILCSISQKYTGNEANKLIEYSRDITLENKVRINMLLNSFVNEINP